MTRVGSARGRMALVVVTLVAASLGGSTPGSYHLDAEPLSRHAAAIGLVPDLLLPASERPVISPYSRSGESERGPWAAVPAETIAIALRLLVDRHVSPPLLPAGGVAQGFSGRGPPSFGDP